MSSGLSSKARSISSSDCCSAARTSRSTSGVTGKRRPGFVTRGQWELRKEVRLDRVGVREGERVARAPVEGLPEVQDLLALDPRDSLRPVPAHLPVEGRLERVLDAQRAALDEEGVAHVGGHRQAAEHVHEPRELDAVEVGQRRLELRDPVQDLEELGVLHSGVVVAEGVRGEEGAEVEDVAPRAGVVHPGAAALLEVEDDVESVGEHVARQDPVDVARGDGCEGRNRHFAELRDWKPWPREDSEARRPRSSLGRIAIRAFASTRWPRLPVWADAPVPSLPNASTGLGPGPAGSGGYNRRSLHGRVDRSRLLTQLRALREPTPGGRPGRPDPGAAPRVRSRGRRLPAGRPGRPPVRGQERGDRGRHHPLRRVGGGRGRLPGDRRGHRRAGAPDGLAPQRHRALPRARRGVRRRQGGLPRPHGRPARPSRATCAWCSRGGWRRPPSRCRAPRASSCRAT